MCGFSESLTWTLRWGAIQFGCRDAGRAAVIGEFHDPHLNGKFFAERGRARWFDSVISGGRFAGSFAKRHTPGMYKEIVGLSRLENDHDPAWPGRCITAARMSALFLDEIKQY